MKKNFIVFLILVWAIPGASQNMELSNLGGTTFKSNSEGTNFSYLIDNNEYTYWESEPFIKRSTDVWLDVELPTDCEVKTIIINWKIPPTSFQVLYDSANTWQLLDTYRNSNNYAERIINNIEVSVNTKKIRIEMLSRVMVSIFTGGDLNDDEELGYAINELKIYGEVPKNENSIN